MSTTNKKDSSINKENSEHNKNKESDNDKENKEHNTNDKNKENKDNGENNEINQDLRSWVDEFTQAVELSLFARIEISYDHRSDNEEKIDSHDMPPFGREEAPITSANAPSDTCAA